VPGDRFSSDFSLSYGCGCLNLHLLRRDPENLICCSAILRSSSTDPLDITEVKGRYFFAATKMPWRANSSDSLVTCRTPLFI